MQKAVSKYINTQITRYFRVYPMDTLLSHNAVREESSMMKNSNEADIVSTWIWIQFWDIWLSSQDEFSRCDLKLGFEGTLYSAAIWIIFRQVSSFETVPDTYEILTK